VSRPPTVAEFPTGPVWPGYFADPAVVRLADGGYAAYGSGPPPRPGAPTGERMFECLLSDDLAHWRSAGPVLERLPDEYGDEYWAPEVAFVAGAYHLFYSVGHGISGHHLRVARSPAPTGPFHDLGVNLTPGERFAIDPHPFRDIDGRWYLFFARDVLDHPRPGTHLAVAPLAEPTTLGTATTVLTPSADWQIYERDRRIYGARFEWHTLEGPFVVHRRGRYWLTYSGGAWTGPGYAVSWAVADHPLGPWQQPLDDAPRLLSTRDGLLGPGHNSIVATPDGDVIAFHAWDATRTLRQPHLRRLHVGSEGPEVARSAHP